MHGVQNICSYRASTKAPEALQTLALSVITWTTLSTPTDSMDLMRSLAIQFAFFTYPSQSTALKNIAPLGQIAITSSSADGVGRKGCGLVVV